MTDMWGTSTAVLTKELLERANEQMLNAPYPKPACPPHLISSARKKKGGWTRCANCAYPVYMPKPGETWEDTREYERQMISKALDRSVER